jgi:hypothetical protein
MSRVVRLLVACAGVVCVGVLAVAAAEAAITAISPEKPVGQWVVEETTGRIFATLPSDDAVVEYDPATGKEVRRFTVPGQPTELIIKQHWLVAACSKSIALTPIDLKTNKALDGVPLAGNGPYALFCSKVDNGFVYAICNTGTAWWDGEIFQVDLSRPQVRKRIRVQGWRQSHPLHVAMSRDGKWIAPDARGASSPSGGTLMSVDEETLTFQDVVHHHSSFGKIVADPGGRWWTLGNLLYPLDLSASVRKFTGSPVAIHPRLDLAVSLQGQELYLEAFTDAKFLKTVPLSASEAVPTPPVVPGKNTKPTKPARTRPSSTPAGEATLQYDLPGNRMVCGLPGGAWVVGLTDLGVELRPRMEILAPSRIHITQGQTHCVPLKTSETKKNLAKITATVVSGPSFAKITGSELVLSPGPRESGQHAIAIKASQGEMSDTVTITVTVGVPSVEVGFAIRDVAIDGEGKIAVAWGPHGLPQQQRPPIRELGGGETPMDFAVIDLAGLKVLSTQSLTTAIQLLAVDDKYIYLTPTSGNLLYRLDRNDLSKRTRVFLPARPTRLVATPDKHVAVLLHGDHSEGTMDVFDRETLQRNAKHSGQRVMGLSPNESVSLWDAAGDDALRFFERIVDRSTGAMRCVLLPVNLPRLGSAPSGPVMPYGERGLTRLWGRALMNDSLVGGQNSRIATMPGRGAISPDVPVLACLRSANEDRQPKTYLEFRNLIQGDVVESLDLGKTGREDRLVDHIFAVPFRWAKDRVLVLQGDRLLVCPLPAAVQKNLPPPLTLKYPRVPIVTVDKPVDVQLAAVGGEGSRTFALVREFEGLTIDAKSGKITVDLPLLWKRHLSSLSSSARDRFEENNGRQGTDPKTAFERLTGEALHDGKVAYAVPLEVAVSDKEGQRDTLGIALVALAPAGDVQKITAARQAEARRQQEEQQKLMAARQEEMRRQQEAAAKSKTEAAKSEGDRIEQLENRIRRLEASLDSILQKLDHWEKAPPNGGSRKETPAP